MSQSWMWRSGDEIRGPLSAGEIAGLLHSRPTRDADEVQPIGGSQWTPAADLADVFRQDADERQSAADAAATLLLTAAELRLSSTFEPSSDARLFKTSDSDCSPRAGSSRWASTLLLSVWSPPRLFSIAAAVGAMLAIAWLVSTPPDSATVYAELRRLHASVTAESNDEQRQLRNARSVQVLIEALEAAASRTPILSLGARPADTNAVLARRELLFAARDLKELLLQNDAPSELDADFRGHMELAAALLSADGPPPERP